MLRILQFAISPAVLVSAVGLLRRCITCYAASLFLSCLIVLLLFLKVLAGWSAAWLVVCAFGLDVLALMAGAAFFLLDVSVALRALDIEVATHLGARRQVRAHRTCSGVAAMGYVLWRRVKNTVLPMMLKALSRCRDIHLLRSKLYGL